MHLVGAFAALCNSEHEYSNNSVSPEMSAVAQGMQCPALPAEHDYAQRKPIERLRRSLGRDVAMQPKAIAPCNTSNYVEKNQRRSRALEKASIAKRSEPIKALLMQNVLKQSMRCGARLSTSAMCCCTAGLRKCLPTSLFSEPMLLVSSISSHFTLRSLALRCK